MGQQYDGDSCERPQKTAWPLLALPQTGAGPPSQARVSTLNSPSAYRLRSTFLSNLPTLVLGTSSMNAQRSGTCHRATLVPRNSLSPAASMREAGARTTVASGRSPHLSSGAPTTEASSTSGCAIRAFSRSTEEIHSPPDLITSLARSVSCRKPLAVRDPTSPVRSQPWSNFEAASARSASVLLPLS